MKRTEFREAEENLIWKWVHEELPKQFGFDTDDTIGHETVIRFQCYEGGKSWIFENDGDELELGLGRDGMFTATLSDITNKISVVSLMFCALVTLKKSRRLYTVCVISLQLQAIGIHLCLLCQVSQKLIR